MILFTYYMIDKCGPITKQRMVPNIVYIYGRSIHILNKIFMFIIPDGNWANTVLFF